MRGSRIAVLVVAGIALALGGCREGEQDRPLSYQKGTYLGKRDAAPSDSARADMRLRVQRQGGAKAFRSLGGGAPSSSVRPPDSASRTRTMQQGYN